MVFPTDVADIRGSRWIREHRGLEIIGTVADRKAKKIDDFIGMRPDQMRAEDTPLPSSTNVL